MRTPWRFLSDLVTRKPADDQVDDHSSEREVDEPKRLPSPDQAGELDLAATENTADHNVTETLPVVADEASGSRPSETEIATSDDQVTKVEEVAAAEGGSDEHASREEVVHAPGVASSGELDTNPAELKSETEASVPKPVVSPKKARPARITLQQAAGTAEGIALKTDAGAKTLFDKMAELDAEISSLRRKLSEKLIEQNEQLRKMVQRFDRT